MQHVSHDWIQNTEISLKQFEHIHANTLPQQKKHKRHLYKHKKAPIQFI